MYDNEFYTYQEPDGRFGLTCNRGLCHGGLPKRKHEHTYLRGHITPEWMEAGVTVDGQRGPMFEAVQRLGEYEATGYNPEEMRAALARLEQLEGCGKRLLGESSVLELQFPTRQSRELARRGLKMAGYPVQCFTEPDARVLAVRMEVE